MASGSFGGTREEASVRRRAAGRLGDGEKRASAPLIVRVTILSPVLQDLAEGYSFYQSKEEGLGHYFLDSLYSDIDSLHFYAGIHPKYFGGKCRAYAALLSSPLR